MPGKEWTNEEVDYLKKYGADLTVPELAKALNRTEDSVAGKRRRLGIAHSRVWSKEEVNYLHDHIGIKSLNVIAKNLNRSLGAIRMKVAKEQLGDPSLHYDGITLCQLAKALGLQYQIVADWEDKFQLPVKRKIFTKEKSIKVITLPDFWKWAEKHKHMLNFARLEPLLLGVEPAWVPKKRGADKMNYEKKNLKRPWTNEELSQLKGLVRSQKYTYPEIAVRLNRSEAAIKRKVYDLELKARPVRSYNRFWTKEEIKTLTTMYDEGYGINTIASKLNRSSLSVRGKMEQMGYTFTRGIPSRINTEKVL